MLPMLASAGCPAEHGVFQVEGGHSMCGVSDVVGGSGRGHVRACVIQGWSRADIQEMTGNELRLL